MSCAESSPNLGGNGVSCRCNKSERAGEDRPDLALVADLLEHLDLALIDLPVCDQLGHTLSGCRDDARRTSSQCCWVPSFEGGRAPSSGASPDAASSCIACLSASDAISEGADCAGARTGLHLRAKVMKSASESDTSCSFVGALRLIESVYKAVQLAQSAQEAVKGAAPVASRA